MSVWEDMQLSPPRAFAKPKWRDFHITGPLVPGALAALRARLLVGATLRQMAKGRPRRAAELLVEVDSKKLQGLEVECERVGLRWRLAPYDIAQRFMFAGGSFEHPLVTWMAGQLRKGDHVVDIGGHVGMFTTQFAHRLATLGGGRVFAFEPAPDSAARLRRHVAMNNLDDLVVVTESAVGTESGTASMRAADGTQEDDPSRRSLHGTGKELGTTVRLLRFDEWWNENGRPAIDVVKIDVEGAEDDVIAGMSEALRATKPRLVVIEIKDHLTRNAGTSVDRVIERLEAVGYTDHVPFSAAVGRDPIPALDENIVFRLGTAPADK